MTHSLPTSSVVRGHRDGVFADDVGLHTDWTSGTGMKLVHMTSSK